MAREDRFRNRYAGSCHYCGKTVAESEGWLFNDTAKGIRNGLRHDHCNEATAKAAADAKAAEPAKAGDAWSAAAKGEPAAIRKPPTLQEAADAVLPHTEVGNAEALQHMLAGALTQAVDAIVVGVTEEVNGWRDELPKLVETVLASYRKVEIQVGTAPAVKLDKMHKALPDIVIMAAAGASPFLVGPAGSGKTTLASQVAKALGVKFYMEARVTSEYKLVGFVDANGKTVRTQFREAYEHGGVFLFDEVDASDPDAMTAFNAALANGWCAFPDGLVERHKDFYAIAAGNTFGRGADRQYVGRNQLDAATLDRFQTYEVDYDEELEVQICGDPDWAKYVQAARKAVEDAKIRHVISPRASIVGAKLLAAGMDLDVVMETCIWKGLDQVSRQRMTASTFLPALTGLTERIKTMGKKEAA